MSILTSSEFKQFLVHLDLDPVLAADKYELLRQKLIKCLVWKKCPESDADALADAALDRLALKLSQGEKVKNLQAYAGEVLRFVWLEYIRRHKEKAVGDALPEIAIYPEFEIFNSPDLRISSLRKCLPEVVPDERDQMLIIGYYDSEMGEKNKDHRKNLAKKLDLNMETLKVKAGRLRNRLEKCINECVAKLNSVTKTEVSVTNKLRGGVQ